jgi:adenosyl cobinamide kinase/adenosyl cobinamide phosphate guanylyltransferase
VSPGTALVLGGVRAGKSAFAVARARALGGRVAFVATAEPADAEMEARIARHRAERPPAWTTIEAPLEVVPAVEGLRGTADVVLVDCLNLWVANLLEESPELSEAEVLDQARPLAAVAAAPPFHLICVSNEVGWGVHPETPIGRRFRDALGLVNQAIARAAAEVVLMVAGCPLVVKGPAPAPARRG